MAERLSLVSRVLCTKLWAPVGVGEQQVESVGVDPAQTPALNDRAGRSGPAGAPQYDTGVVVRSAVVTSGHQRTASDRDGYLLSRPAASWLVDSSDAGCWQ